MSAAPDKKPLLAFLKSLRTLSIDKGLQIGYSRELCTPTVFEPPGLQNVDSFATAYQLAQILSAQVALISSNIAHTIHPQSRQKDVIERVAQVVKADRRKDSSNFYSPKLRSVVGFRIKPPGNRRKSFQEALQISRQLGSPIFLHLLVRNSNARYVVAPMDGRLTMKENQEYFNSLIEAYSRHPGRLADANEQFAERAIDIYQTMG